MATQSSSRREQLAVLLVLGLLTVAAWSLTLSQMSSMAGMSSTSGGAMGDAPAMGSGMAMPTEPVMEPGLRLLVFLGTWVTMMAAMMLPSAMPMILMFGTIYRRQRERGGAFVPTWVFVAGYLGVWAAFGAYAYGLGLLGGELARAYPWLGGLGPRVAGGAMLLAGLYQLTPLKERCLSHCRSPLHFVIEHWRSGPLGALQMGARHGVYCVGCCWLLMVLLVAVGLSSLPWMGLITLIILAEKLLPRGRVVTSAVAVALVGLGLLVLARPDLLAPLLA